MAPRGTVLAPALAESPPKARGINVVAMKSRGVVSQPEDRHRTRAAQRPFLMEHDILRVENVDDVDWEFRWDRRRYLVRAGETNFIPFPAVSMAMGDPRAVDGEMMRYSTEDGVGGVVMTRHEEFCRLFARYGIENENLDELIDFAPRLVVETMEGEPVQFPVQNPEMVAFPVPNAPKRGQEATDGRRIDSLQSDNEDLRRELAEMRSLIAAKLGGPDDVEVQMDARDNLSAALVGGGASPDMGPASSF